MAYVDIIWNDQEGNYLCAQNSVGFFVLGYGLHLVGISNILKQSIQSKTT